MSGADYRSIVAHYEARLAEYGDDPRGVDWPNQEDANTRFDVMLGVIQPDAIGPVSLLDFGCGAAHMLDYLQRREWRPYRYIGLDLSPSFIDLCRSKYPQDEFICADVLETPDLLPQYDYAVMNGVFTERVGVSEAAMFDYLKRLVAIVFSRARRGVAFNVMSSHVDWKRDDLFHVPLDQLAEFLVAEVTRHRVIRHDYGLYEYTVYIYADPNAEGEG